LFFIVEIHSDMYDNKIVLIPTTVLHCFQAKTLYRYIEKKS
jgi:hypothetical protein